MLKSAIESSEMPSHVILFMTNRCNSECIGCLYQNKLNSDKHKDLSFNEIQKIFSQFSNLNKINLSGGEPFLREDFLEICKLFIDVPVLRIPTNGLLTSRIIEYTSEILKSYRGDLGIAVSIDGYQEANGLRPKESFDISLKTLSGLCKLKGRYPNLHVTVSSCLTSDNIGNVKRLIPFINRNYDIDGHLIFPIRGKIEESSIHPPTKHQFLEVCRIYHKLIPSLKKRLRKRIYHNMIGNSLDGGKWPFPCVGGNDIGVIESDGDVKLCELMEPIGNLRDNDHDFNVLWNSKKANDQRRLIKNRQCTKGCTHGCFLGPSAVKHPFLTLRNAFQ